MSILEKLGKKIDIVRPPPGMYTLNDKEYGYIDDRVYLYSLIMKYEGGVLIPRNHSFMGVHVAIPSQFAESLTTFLALPRHLRPEAPAARVKWALDRLIREKYSMGEYVLLDMVNEDEGRLRRLTGSCGFDTGKIFLTEKNWRLLPKAFKKWEPKNTQIDASSAGFRLTFYDDMNRPLIRVIVDDAKENVQNNMSNKAGAAKGLDRQTLNSTQGSRTTVTQPSTTGTNFQTNQPKRVSWALADS